MKLKFQIKKNNQVTHENVADSMEAGDAWVAANQQSFGRGDLSLSLELLPQYGLTPEQAASTSEEPMLDTQGQPVLDENQNPILQTIYHFPKEWSVEVVDITADAAQETKVESRTAARQFCLSVINEIAAINKDMNDPQLMATIFSTASFQGIILALLTGATATARALMAQHGPSLYSQGVVDGLIAKMDAFLASET